MLCVQHSLVTVRLGAAVADLRPELARLPHPALVAMRGQVVPLNLSEVSPHVHYYRLLATGARSR